MNIFYYFQTTIRVYFRILKEYPRCASVYSECTLVRSTFRVYSGIVWVSLEQILSFANYYQSIFQNTQRLPKMGSSILWAYFTFKVYSGILWVSLEYTLLFSNYYQSIFLEYSNNTQDVLYYTRSVHKCALLSNYTLA